MDLQKSLQFSKIIWPVDNNPVTHAISIHPGYWKTPEMNELERDTNAHKNWAHKSVQLSVENGLLSRVWNVHFCNCNPGSDDLGAEWKWSWDSRLRSPVTLFWALFGIFKKKIEDLKNLTKIFDWLLINPRIRAFHNEFWSHWIFYEKILKNKKVRNISPKSAKKVFFSSGIW